MAVLDPERAMPRSALRYRPVFADDQAVPGSRPVTRPRRHAPDDLEEERNQLPRRRSVAPVQRTRSRRRIHPLFFLGLALLLSILLWVGISQAVNWGNNELNTLKYGNPRTFQMDQMVGGGDSTLHPSHFLALNLRGKVMILELPAGDPGKERVLATTTITDPDADQAVVTLRFVDVSQNGEPDMLIDVAGVQSILINEGGTFQVPTAAQQQQILETLQQ
jgi:hypothetical protein